MKKLLLLLMALVVSHGALAQAGEGSGAQVGSQPAAGIPDANGCLHRADGLPGCSAAGTFIPFAGCYADRYNCPLYNGIIAVAWAPELVYAPWIWYYFLAP